MTVNHDVTGSSPVGGVKRSLYLWSVGQGVKTPPFHGGNTGSNPVRTIMWRITQVRLKGTVLKTVRRVKARKGSNPLSSFSGLRPLYCHGCWRFSDITDMIHLSESSQYFLIIIAGWSSWQLAGLITRRSQVQVLSPQLS